MLKGTSTAGPALDITRTARFEAQSQVRSALGLVWKVRHHLPPPARSALRLLVDLVLAHRVGSLSGVRTKESVIGLTFDDGPDPTTTPAVLDVLAAHGARATFFLLAHRAEALPAIACRIIEEGHEVGLHGADHRPPAGLERNELGRWFQDGRRRLESVVSRSVLYFRPPCGSQSLRSYLASRRAGLQVVVWSAHAADWEGGTPAEVTARGLTGIAPGRILLLHDGYEPDPRQPIPDLKLDRGAVAALLMDQLATRGYRTATISQLVTGRPPIRTAWFRP